MARWQDKFVITNNGKPRSGVLNNVTLVFKNDDLFKGKFRFNQFSRESEIVEKFLISGVEIKSGLIDDVGLDLIVGYLQRTYELTVDPSLVYRAFNVYSRLNSYNPAIDFFDEAKKEWDGKKRFSNFFPDYLGAPKNDVTTLITKLFFVGAVAKVFEPKTQFDFVLDLVGDQGVGKTTLLKKMGGDWYVDTIEDFKSKDEYTKMLRALIVNDDEMKASKSSSPQSLKKFVTQTDMEFRKPFERTVQRYEKHFVLARTTNEVNYLTDKTGSRRFLPIYVNKKKQQKNPVTDLTDNLIKQIWGEAVSYFQDEGVLYPNKKEQEMLEKARENFEYIDEIENQITQFVDNNDLDWVSTSDIAKAALHIDDIVKHRKISQRIKYIMDNKPNWEWTRRGQGTRGWKKTDITDTKLTLE